MFGRKTKDSYPYVTDACEAKASPSMDAWSFAQAVREVVDAPRPSGPRTLIFAVEGSLDSRDLPDDVDVVFVSVDAPFPTVITPRY